MKTCSYIIAITIGLLISMPSYSEDMSSESFESDSGDDFNAPISEYDIGDSIGFSNSEANVVDESIYFDDDVLFSFNNKDEEKKSLATPIPAAIWLFTTGLLGLSSIVKRHKKT